MKQKLLLLLVMLLSTMGTWAKDVNSAKAAPDGALTLTIIVKDHAGQPMQNCYVSIGEAPYQTDENGTAVAPVRAGRIEYRVSSTNPTDTETPVYLGISGTIMIGDASVTKVISYQDAHLLTFELTGKSLPSTDYNPSVSIYPPDHGISGYVRMERTSESPLTYKGRIYAMDGEYEYRYGTHPYWSGIDSQSITVSGDQTIKLAMDNCQEVTFTLNGEPFESNSSVYIKTADGGYVGSDYSFLSPGKYIASAEARFDNTYVYPDDKAFTVADAPVTVNFVFNPNDYHKVNVSFLNFSEGMYGDIEFLNDSYSVDCSSGSSNKYVYLPSGNYTYRVEIDSKTSNMSFPLVGTIRIADRDESLTIDANDFVHVSITVKNPEGGLVKDALFELGKDGVYEWEDGNEDVDALELLAPAGTYELSILRGGYKTMSTNVTINASTQTLEYTLQKGNVTAVIFDVYDENIDSEALGAKVTLAGYGIRTYKGGGDGVIMFADVAPANSLAYTIEAPGYNTLTGTLSVSLSDNAPYIYVEVNIANGTVVGIENTTADANKTFSVYPTTPADYVYIRSEVQEAGEWMAQLVSATGAVVYADKLLLDGETSVYVGNQPKGLYVLMLTKGSERMAFKILKK